MFQVFRLSDKLDARLDKLRKLKGSGNCCFPSQKTSAPIMTSDSGLDNDGYRSPMGSVSEDTTVDMPQQAANKYLDNSGIVSDIDNRDGHVPNISVISNSNPHLAQPELDKVLMNSEHVFANTL